MLKLGLFRSFLFFIVMISIASCTKFRKLEKNPDWKVKYDAALDYFEKKDYSRASILFEQILPIVRGLPEGEKVQLNFAYCQFYQDYFLLAAHHFKTFYTTYARSEFAQEGRYMEAYSLYANSPAYNLDQTSSIEAVVAMQNFINRYPQSEFRDDATEVINEIQVRLELKAYENAKLYYKLEYFKASIVAFESFASDYPDSEYNEEISYLKFVAQFRLAEKSIPSLQEERYRIANEFYIDFLDSYPSSDYLRDADKKYGTSLDKLNQIAKKN